MDAIRLENVSKHYSLAGAPAGPRGWRRWFAARAAAPPPSGLWALDRVSFGIKPGEIVGIIGRNGAGKSTLLKVLSRITAPTSGRIEVNGSMASLLEVGTGFHPELSGRENIFLNGSILGMSRAAIREKFDEIVAFSEISRFIDTPVKRYSSGMYVRLAFAVAAHLDPEILLVDEVLAVGDGAFQKKCLGKLQDAGRGNKTVLFVSHNLPTVRSLCSRAILIQDGGVALDGNCDEVLTAYNRMLQTPRDLSQSGLTNRLWKTVGSLRMNSITARGESGESRWEFRTGDRVRLEIGFHTTQRVPDLGMFLTLTSQTSGEVVTTVKRVLSEKALASGTNGTLEIELPKIPLRPGQYLLYIALGDKTCGTIYDIIDKNQDLPWLSISSEEKDAQRTAGYFDLEATATWRDEGSRRATG